MNYFKLPAAEKVHIIGRGGKHMFTFLIMVLLVSSGLLVYYIRLSERLNAQMKMAVARYNALNLHHITLKSINKKQEHKVSAKQFRIKQLEDKRMAVEGKLQIYKDREMEWTKTSEDLKSCRSDMEEATSKQFELQATVNELQKKVTELQTTIQSREATELVQGKAKEIESATSDGNAKLLLQCSTLLYNAGIPLPPALAKIADKRYISTMKLKNVDAKLADTVTEKRPFTGALNEKLPLTDHAFNAKLPVADALNENLPVAGSLNEKLPVAGLLNEKLPVAVALNEKLPVLNNDMPLDIS